MSEAEQRLQQLTNAVLAGDSEETRQKTYAALAKATPTEALDAVIEAANILLDLNELGGTDRNRLLGAEAAINACLQVLETILSSSEGKFDFTVAVGPVGFEWGHLLSTPIAALLRSVGFHAANLTKTKTALDLLRNSEELGAEIVIPLLAKDELDAQLQSLKDEIERGGFASKLRIFPVARGLAETGSSPLYTAKNIDEAVSKALEWAIRNSEPA